MVTIQPDGKITTSAELPRKNGKWYEDSTPVELFTEVLKEFNGEKGQLRELYRNGKGDR